MACLELGEETGTRIPPNDRTATVPVNDAFIHLRAFLSSPLPPNMWLCLLAAFVAWKVTPWLWMRWNYDLHKIPTPPRVPFLGHALKFIKEPNTPVYKHVNKWRQDLGDPKVIRVRLFLVRQTC